MDVIKIKKKRPSGGLKRPRDKKKVKLIAIKSKHPTHRGEPVRVGSYEILAGGTRDLKSQDLEKADVLIPLLDGLPKMSFGKSYQILAAPLEDFGGVPEDWEFFLHEQVIPLLASGKKVLAFCMGSHGRTGCFLASLISILESPEETPDPIAAVRERHCRKAVESRKQGEAIFALRGQDLPEKYKEELRDIFPGQGYGSYGDLTEYYREREIIGFGASSTLVGAESINMVHSTEEKQGGLHV
jgi:hypothetical protein